MGGALKQVERILARRQGAGAHHLECEPSRIQGSKRNHLWLFKPPSYRHSGLQERHTEIRKFESGAPFSGAVVPEESNDEDTGSTGQPR